MPSRTRVIRMGETLTAALLATGLIALSALSASAAPPSPPDPASALPPSPPAEPPPTGHRLHSQAHPRRPPSSPSTGPLSPVPPPEAPEPPRSPERSGPPKPPGPTGRSPVGGHPWRWPIDGTPHILRRFNPPPVPWLAGHRGVDLALAVGTPVLAAGAGTVGYAGPVAGRGVVTVHHPDGRRTTYLPLVPSVRRGDPVSGGDRLGTLAESSPHCSEPCLHWGLREGNVYLDPLLLLAGTRLRLLPYWEHDLLTGGTSPSARPAVSHARPLPRGRP